MPRTAARTITEVLVFIFNGYAFLTGFRFKPLLQPLFAEIETESQPEFSFRLELPPLSALTPLALALLLHSLSKGLAGSCYIEIEIKNLSPERCIWEQEWAKKQKWPVGKRTRRSLRRATIRLSSVNKGFSFCPLPKIRQASASIRRLDLAYPTRHKVLRSVCQFLLGEVYNLPEARLPVF